MEKILKIIKIGAIELFLLLFIIGCITKNVKAEEKPNDAAIEEEGDKEPVLDEPNESRTEEPVNDKTFNNPILNMNDEKVKEAIKAEAEAVWQNDYSMAEFQIETQTKSYNNLKGLAIDSQVKQDVLNDALKAWKNDFTMVEYQYESQMEAYNNIKELNLDSQIKKDILVEALNTWGNDFMMAEYQYKQQLEAYINSNGN